MSSIGDSNTPTINEDNNTNNLSSNEESRSRMISDIKKLHFKEITELRV
jgi:hypothetical protein